MSGTKTKVDEVTKPLSMSEMEIGESKLVQLEKDKALHLLQDYTDIDLNSSEAKAVLKKIDYIVLPLLCLIYTLMLIDKSSLSFANVMGIQEELHLTGLQYSWLGSLVYFGYLAGDVPAMILMQRAPLDKVFSGAVVIWGSVVALHAAGKSFAALAVLRFLLGFCEVFTAPAVLQMLSSWYTKEEQITRLPIWYTCYGFGNVFGGFLAWCIYQAPSWKWQALFILYGALTITTGIIMYFLLPASPTGARWLNDREKAIALERVRQNKTGTEVWSFNKGQLVESLLDPRLYLIFFYLLCLGLPTGGLTVFGPSIIAGFGFTKEQSTLLSMGPGGAAIIGVLMSTVLAKYTNRSTAGIFVHVVSIIGTVMMLAIPASNYPARYGGYVLALWFPNANAFIMAQMTAGVSGSTKKFAFSAAYQLGPAKYTMLAFLVFGAILLLVLYAYHKYMNYTRDKQDAEDERSPTDGIVHEVIENEEFLDRTDHQIRSFRYPL
ncbi:unnamed protein product [Clonostachys rosea]|uniref:Major facilitator superfamily (MFS) profile domain-containing protein n=1 Tax=Bionectria ochroleuca TaxID=29856 RepID=A0ABY6TYI6_BIOOC|nr:unnamed protein product [Clonostachys rosea]